MPASERSGRVSERVHEHLRREILDGNLAPGDPVPSERSLATDLQANRHAVREALKRLEQAGLVRIAQGGPTRVLDWRDSGGLEVLLDLVGGARRGAPPLELVRSVLEMRECIGVDAARRSAARAPGETRSRIDRLAQAAATAVGTSAIDEEYAALWLGVVAGSQNVAYRLSLNSLLAAVSEYEGIADITRPKDAEAIRALGRAIRGGDVAGAGEAARALLEPDTHALD